MMRFDPEKVKKNVERATTEDLLDRVTVYLAGMEPEAVELIERELARRGVLPDEVERHAAQRRQSGVIRDETGCRAHLCCLRRTRRGSALELAETVRCRAYLPAATGFLRVHRLGGPPAGQDPESTKPSPASANDHFGASS